MKSKKPKKRYTSVEQIRSEIDRCHVRIEKLEKESSLYDAKARELILFNDPLSAESIGFNQLRAKQIRKSISRILDKRLPHLSQKLSEFSTDVLPGCGIQDRSVQA